MEVFSRPEGHGAREGVARVDLGWRPRKRIAEDGRRTGWVAKSQLRAELGPRGERIALRSLSPAAGRGPGGGEVGYFSAASPACCARCPACSMVWPIFCWACSMVLLPCSTSAFLRAAAVAAVLAVSTPQPARAAAARRAMMGFMGFLLVRLWCGAQRRTCAFRQDAMAGYRRMDAVPEK